MILDTSALSAWAGSDALLFRRVPMDRPWVVSTITLGEYRFGLLKSDRRVALERWIEDFLIEREALVPDVQTARLYARLRYDTSRADQAVPYHDSWIGALALQHGLPVVSRDRHFDAFPGVRRIGW